MAFALAVGLFLLLRDDGSGGTATTADDPSDDPTAGRPAASGEGTLAVDLERIDGMFVEGFDVTLRFYGAGDDLLAEREWSKVAPDGEGYYSYVHREPVPAGPVRLVSFVRISPGGAVPPPEGPGCETDVDIADGDTARVTLLLQSDPDASGGCAAVSAASAAADEMLAMPRGLPAPGFVGLTTDEAEAEAADRGWTVRVVAEDGERFMVTEDYNPDRVNLVVEQGKVTAAARS